LNALLENAEIFFHRPESTQLYTQQETVMFFHFPFQSQLQCGNLLA